MEIFREDKISKWKHILKKISKSKNADTERLNTIKNQIEKQQSPSESNIGYLEEKYKEINQSTVSTQLDSSQDTEKKPNLESELKIIEQLHQKKIGDFSRLESIRNYLMDNQPLLVEDSDYLKEQYKQFQKAPGSKADSPFQTISKKRTSPLKPQSILIDDVEETPTHDFDSLSKTISNIMRNSTPHFTIGIYGEWGTGKTTLMKSIARNLVSDDVQNEEQFFLPIWFNAWKYEREENLASVSLMKTVGYAMANHDVFDPLSRIIFKGLTIVGKDMMQQIVMQAVSKKRELADEEMEEKMDYINKLYRESVYYEGLDKIKEQMASIREEHGDYRVVVFIDDLDRCSPVKALEVLESIKLFLDMEGFIFVIGLSHKTVTQLITQAYKLTGISGDDYIKKIIQIPIKIPSWTKESIIDLINTTITPRLNSDYTKFLSQNSSMVAKVVDYNPRQLKRFINNVIVAFETFASKQDSPEIQFNDIFLVKILKSEWPDFYQELVSNKDFLDIVKWIMTKPKDLRKYFKYLRTSTVEFPEEKRNKRISLLNKIIEYSNGRIDSNHIDMLADFENETWIFFENVKEVLFGIDNWKVIDNVMDVVEEFSYDLAIGSTKSKKEQEKKVEPQKPIVD